MIAEIKAKAISLGMPWQTLMKETLQTLFLEAFYALPQTSRVTFQGGTSIRLIYGGPRHSEDLDFVTLGSLQEFENLRHAIFGKLKAQEPLLDGTLELTAQKSFSKILRWKLKWAPSGTSPRTAVPNAVVGAPREGGEKVFVRVELAQYPAHTRELKPLLSRPGGAWTIIPVESLEEILTDKLAAIAGRPYLKGRDFFDLWFLDSQKVKLRIELLREKLKDYNASPEGLLRRSREVDETLLQRDLAPFLPDSLRHRFEEEHYQGIVRAAKTVIQQAVKELSA